MKKIISYGEIIIDEVIKNNKLESKHVGGAPLNVAAQISKFKNVDSYLFSILPFKNNKNRYDLEKIEESIKSENILKEYLIYKDDGLSLAYSLAKIDKNGEREFEFNLDKASFLSFKKDDYKYLLNNLPDLFYLGTISSLNFDNFENIISILKILKEKNVIIAFDPNYRQNLFYIDDWKMITKEILKFVDILKISKEELFLLFNTNDEVLALKMLNTIYKNFKIVLMSDGDKGSLIDIAYKKKVYFLKGNKVKKDKIKDAIGCGDAFFGGFIGSLFSYNQDLITNDDSLFLLSDETLINSLKIANSCGSLAIKREGALPMATLKEIENEMKVNNLENNLNCHDFISLEYIENGEEDGKC